MKSDAEIFKEQLEQIPKPEIPGVVLSRIETITTPHPYCITPKHVAHAADHFGGLLTAEAIENAENSGAACDICRTIKRDTGRPILPYNKHETFKTLFIKVPHSDLNKIEGLVEYLNKIKPISESMGITGFAFPSR